MHTLRSARILPWNGVAGIGLLALGGFSGCSCGSSGSEPAPAPAGSQAGTSQSIPQAVDGYPGCTDPSCSEAARACDDFLRSGCGKTEYPYDGPLPGTGMGTDEYQGVVGACATAVRGVVEELVMENDEGAEDAADAGAAASDDQDFVQKAVAFELSNVARCTRRASDCQQMADCMKGMHLLPPFPAGVPLPPPVEAGAPVAEPYWAVPYKGDSLDPLDTPNPWDGGVTLMPTDSPSCVACAMDRCPTFAYFCFGAEGNSTYCPNGDCCHSLRRCVRACGGYEPRAAISKFYQCLARCQQGRPHATQQLANLQNCTDVACRGCDSYDVSSDGGAP